MMKKFLIIALALTALFATSAVSFAACNFKPSSKLTLLANSYAAWKAVSDSMGECGNFEAELDAEFRKKQPDAFAANPSLYQLGGISNSTIQPLLSAGTIRALDDLVAKYGQDLQPNQLIRINGQIMAIAMSVNNQHLMYREDVLNSLGIAVPQTYYELLSAVDKIAASGQVDYALGGTYKAGWNLAEEFVNMYLGMGGQFFKGIQPNVNNVMGIRTLEMMRNLTHYMDPEYLTSDSTYAQKQMQQEKIAMAYLWATRAAAMDNAEESKVVGKIVMASAPMGDVRPASTLWWDGIVIAKNISDAKADAAFKVAMEGLDTEMVTANNDDAVWLITGFKPGPSAAGASATAANGAAPYPAGSRMGVMHTALGNGISDFLTGKKDAASALADIEAAYTSAAKEKGLM